MQCHNDMQAAQEASRQDQATGGSAARRGCMSSLYAIQLTNLVTQWSRYVVGYTAEGLLQAAPLLLGHVFPSGRKKKWGVGQTSALPPSRYTRAERTLPLAGTLDYS